MSYLPFKNNDVLSELISSTNDMILITDKIIENQNNLQSCMLWIDKGMSIDKRFILLFLKKNKDKLSDNIIKYIEQFEKPNNITKNDVLS